MERHGPASELLRVALKQCPARPTREQLTHVCREARGPNHANPENDYTQRRRSLPAARTSDTEFQYVDPPPSTSGVSSRVSSVPMDAQAWSSHTSSPDRQANVPVYSAAPGSVESTPSLTCSSMCSDGLSDKDVLLVLQEEQQQNAVSTAEHKSRNRKGWVKPGFWGVSQINPKAEALEALPNTPLVHGYLNDLDGLDDASLIYEYFRSVQPISSTTIAHGSRRGQKMCRGTRRGHGSQNAATQGKQCLDDGKRRVFTPQRTKALGIEACSRIKQTVTMPILRGALEPVRRAHLEKHKLPYCLYGLLDDEDPVLDVDVAYEFGGVDTIALSIAALAIRTGLHVHDVVSFQTDDLDLVGSEGITRALCFAVRYSENDVARGRLAEGRTTPSLKVWENAEGDFYAWTQITDAENLGPVFTAETLFHIGRLCFHV